MNKGQGQTVDLAERFRAEMMAYNLQEKYKAGYSAGFKEAAEPTLRSCFAAVCLALNDLYGFSQGRCAKVLRAVDQHMTETLTSTEAIEEVWQRMKLQLVFDDPFDRIQEL